MMALQGGSNVNCIAQSRPTCCLLHKSSTSSYLASPALCSTERSISLASQGQREQRRVDSLCCCASPRQALQVSDAGTPSTSESTAMVENTKNGQSTTARKTEQVLYLPSG